MQSTDEEILETSSSLVDLESKENEEAIQEEDDIKSELKKIHERLKAIEDDTSYIKEENKKESLNAFGFATMALGLAMLFQVMNVITVTNQIIFLVVGLTLLIISFISSFSKWFRNKVMS